MRKLIRSERDLYKWLFEQKEEEESFDAAVTKRAKDIISTKKVTDVVPKLDKAPGAVIDVLRGGLQDNDATDDVVTTKEGQKPVNTLFPTQNEISLMKSVGYALSSFDKLKNIATGDPTGRKQGIIVSDTFIIDGHHRWSSIAAIAGPGGMVLTKDVALPGATADEKLVAAQVAIAAKVGTPLPKAPGSGEPDNVLKASAPKIEQMIKDNLGNNTETGNPMLSPEYLAQVIPSAEGKQYFGLTGTEQPEQAKQMIIAKVAQNLDALNDPMGDPPPRIDMPQFDPKVGGPAFDTVSKDLASGEVNLKDPLMENRIRRIHLPGIRRRW